MEAMAGEMEGWARGVMDLVPNEEKAHKLLRNEALHLDKHGK